MDCDGCKKPLENNLPAGCFHMEREFHTYSSNLCAVCAMKVEHYILWRLD